MTERALPSAWGLLPAVVRAAPVTKDVCMELIRYLAIDLQAMCWAAEATTTKLVER